MIRRIPGLIDLTSLEPQDDETKIAALAARGRTVLGPVAAVCVWPHLVAAARPALVGSGIKIAAVANFPGGENPIGDTLAECRTAIDAGADEIDLVYPYRSHLNGNACSARDYVARIRDDLDAAIILKVILETGAHPDAVFTEDMASAACAAGADFLKTSTGKIPAGADPAAVAILLKVAVGAGRHVGVKASGGIRRADQAVQYLGLADAAFGRPVTARDFRFGASGLLDDVLTQLGTVPGQASESAY